MWSYVRTLNWSFVKKSNYFIIIPNRVEGRIWRLNKFHIRFFWTQLHILYFFWLCNWLYSLVINWIWGPIPTFPLQVEFKQNKKRKYYTKSLVNETHISKMICFFSLYNAEFNRFFAVLNSLYKKNQLRHRKFKNVITFATSNQI
jgi:hypothetical protein